GSPADLAAGREAIEAAGMEVDSAELTMGPKTTVSLDDEAAAKKTLRLIDTLEEVYCVQEVYANCDSTERVMEPVAGYPRAARRSASGGETAAAQTTIAELIA